MKASDLFTLPDSLPFSRYFPADVPPWEWLKAIAQALASVDFSALPARASLPPGVHVEGPVFLHPEVRLPPVATIIGPAWIGAGTEVRPGAFIRGQVIVGERCVLGNACEYKNCLLMDAVQTPHYNYVGDSILGTGAHLGAGVILANLRLDQAPVVVTTPEGRVNTGLRKIGALMGEHAEVGCNSVLQPGTILGKRAVVAPLSPYSGYLPPDSIAHQRTPFSILPRRK